MCTSVNIPLGNLLNKTIGPTNWTQFTYNYTALSTMPILIFGFSGRTNVYNYLDDVSIVDNNNAPSIQLLNNPSFENITSNMTGWSAWCATATNCVGGFPGRILTNGTCHSGSCYFDHCRTNYDYLLQAFPATIGYIYTLSFWFQSMGVGTFKFYATVMN